MIDINPTDGTLLITQTFDLMAATGSSLATPRFDKPGDEYILTFADLSGVECITDFYYDTLGLTSNRYLDTFYRVSRDGEAYSQWFPLNNKVKDFPSVEPLYMDIKWVRNGSSKIGSIKILEYKITGIATRQVVDDGSTTRVLSGNEKIIKAPYIYKVFKLTGFEIVSGSDLSTTDIKWRWSQDNSRTWSQWESLTEANVSTVRINPIRFFQVEYAVSNNGNSSISIQDINLIGDFQNVSLDYRKSNLMGIRDNCTTNVVGGGYYDQGGNFVSYPNPAGTQGNVSAGISGDNCQTDQYGSTLPTLTNDNKAGLYNPYQQNTAMTLLNKLSTDAQEVFGHRVIYFATDPDRKGTDHTLHEYQLYNVACEGEVKVSVEGNNFPDSQIVMNQFDLNLFSTMEVHITKKMFKEVFGPQRRPAKEDFLYFCQLNRMYTVDHAQQFRGFNNSAVYYKLILKKYSKPAHISITDSEIGDTLKKLTQNSTLDELMGIEASEDKKSIANKEQFRTLTDDPIRHSYTAQIRKELLENSTTIISKSNYDLSVVDFGQPAVVYNNIDPLISEGDNIGFMMWFSIHNYVPGDVYGMFSFYQEDTNQGWKITLSDDRFTVKINSDEYYYDLNQTNDATGLDEETWYCYVMNIDQRQKLLSQYIYKRDVNNESMAGSLNNTILRKVYNNSQSIEPFESLIESTRCQLLGSDMKVTNIRLFNDIIPENVHNKILNQMIVGNDARYLVFADNANTRLSLPRFPYNE